MKNFEDLNPRTIMILIISLALILAFTDTLFGQSNIEYLQTNSKETSRFRPNLYYTFPFKIKEYAYIELYMDGKNYFGQNYLTRQISGIFSLQVESYFSSFFKDYTGFGPMVTVPTKESTILTFSLMPAFFCYKSGYMKNYVLMEFVFFTEFKIPSLGKWRINSFGHMNVASKGGPTWEYGEIYLEKPINEHFYIGAGADLFCNTKWYPDSDLGVKLGYTF